MNRRKTIISIFLLLIFFVFFGNNSHAYAEDNNTICKGVFIDEVDVSSMTKEEAEEAVNGFVEGLRNKGIAIMVNDNVVYTTLGDIGYTYEMHNSIEEALNLGKSGNLIKRYKDLKDIEQGKVVYPLTFTLDDAKLKAIISEEVSKYNIAPVNATVSRKNKKFIYTDHIVGKKVDVDQTAEIIKNSVFNNWNRTDIAVDAVLVDDIPVYTRDVVELVKTKLGTYTTEYASSAEGRAANLANGARLINNAVIYPGEVFSGYEFLAPFNASNGYYVASAYLQGKVIDSVGGGACQVTTTLYNAVLASELEVVERKEHSMTISYVDLSRDAAIAGTYKDFKFKNNTDVPILIEAYTKDRKITFNIWGHETRDTKNRRVEYITRVLSETQPPADVIKEDPEKPTTFRDVTQSAHTGYKAELYKVVYENNVEVSRTLVNKSYYAAAPRYITIGTKVEEEKPEEKKKSKDTKTEEEAEPTQNQTNPDGQLQADVWDEAWDDEGFEDE